MSDIIVHKDQDSSLTAMLLSSTGESINRCYQCGKCSAGCPMSVNMDYPPSLILRMIQYEEPSFDDKVLRSNSIWYCLTCEICIARCPQEVDIPKIMDALRVMSIKQKKVNKMAKDIVAFHKSFLDTVNYTGRLYEMGLIAGYKMRSMHLFQDLLMAPRMFFKGKLSPFPHSVKGRKYIRSIFTRTIKRSNKGETA